MPNRTKSAKKSKSKKVDISDVGDDTDFDSLRNVSHNDSMDLEATLSKNIDNTYLIILMT